MLNLENKIAIVTGCGSEGNGWGNGRAIATLLSRQGATVIGTDLNIDHANNTKDYIVKEGNVCETYEVDMVDVDEVDFFFKKILKKYSNIDILVNNVGRSEPGDPESMTFKTWHEQFNVNIDSAFLCIKYVLPVMKKNK